MGQVQFSLQIKPCSSTFFGANFKPESCPFPPETEQLFGYRVTFLIFPVLGSLVIIEIGFAISEVFWDKKWLPKDESIWTLELFWIKEGPLVVEIGTEMGGFEGAEVWVGR